MKALIEEACSLRPCSGTLSLAAGKTSEARPLPGGIFLKRPNSHFPLFLLHPSPAPLVRSFSIPLHILSYLLSSLLQLNLYFVWSLFLLTNKVERVWPGSFLLSFYNAFLQDVSKTQATSYLRYWNLSLSYRGCSLCLNVLKLFRI